MPTGKALIAEIDAAAVAAGELVFWWLGQHSFVVKTRSAVIYLDPYLSADEARQVPPLLAPGEVTDAAIITGSHDHGDHIDHAILPVLLAASPAAVLVVPAACAGRLQEEGIAADRLRPLDDETSVTINGVKITAIKAAHELLRQDAAGHHMFLSYVIESDGVTILHAGDACMYDGLASRLAQWEFTVAFLPINGRDARRLKANCIGNMTYQEAADLAGVLQPAVTVPAHFEMFAMNSADPVLFAEYMEVKYPDLDCRIPEHGVGVKVIKTGE